MSCLCGRRRALVPEVPVPRLLIDPNNMESQSTSQPLGAQSTLSSNKTPNHSKLTPRVDNPRSDKVVSKPRNQSAVPGTSSGRTPVETKENVATQVSSSSFMPPGSPITQTQPQTSIPRERPIPDDAEGGTRKRINGTPLAPGKLAGVLKILTAPGKLGRGRGSGAAQAAKAAMAPSPGAAPAVRH